VTAPDEDAEELIDWASYRETRAQLEAEKRAVERQARRETRWSWESGNNTLPLDELFAGIGNLKVMRVLWGDPRLWWPTEIARRAGLSRTSVYAALGRLEDWRMVRRVATYDGSSAYQLDRRHPVVRHIEHLFTMEAGLRGGWLRG
jgi:hypothetical protein